MEGFTRTRCAFLEVGVGPTMIPTVGGSPSGSGHLLDSPFGVCRPAEVDKGDDAISAGVVFHVGIITANRIRICVSRCCHKLFGPVTRFV